MVKMCTLTFGNGVSFSFSQLNYKVFQSVSFDSINHTGIHPHWRKNMVPFFSSLTYKGVQQLVLRSFIFFPLESTHTFRDVANWFRLFCSRMYAFIFLRYGTDC